MPTKARLARLQRRLDRAGVEHFSAMEFFVKGSSHYNQAHRGYGLNTDPPEYLDHHIIPTAVVWEEARVRLDRPVRLTSVYRSPAYNLAIKSTNPENPRTLWGRGSQHPRFSAIDGQDWNQPWRYAEKIHAILLQMRREGTWVGGLGRYNRFTHADTRPYAASWG